MDTKEYMTLFKSILIILFSIVCIGANTTSGGSVVIPTGGGYSQVGNTCSGCGSFYIKGDFIYDWNTRLYNVHVYVWSNSYTQGGHLTNTYINNINLYGNTSGLQGNIPYTIVPPKQWVHVGTLWSYQAQVYTMAYSSVVPY